MYLGLLLFLLVVDLFIDMFALVLLCLLGFCVFGWVEVLGFDYWRWVVVLYLSEGWVWRFDCCLGFVWI